MEECDDGNEVNDDACSNNCTVPVCGNGVIEFGEQCDDGNTIATDSCTDTCQDAICGDRITRTDLAEGDADMKTVMMPMMSMVMAVINVKSVPLLSS